jgi:hypothetical protein
LLRFLIVFILFFNAIEVFSTECPREISHLLQSYEQFLKDNGIFELGTVETGIPRVGSHHRREMNGMLEGLFEINISSLSYLHPIPNPLREGSAEKLANLIHTIPREGFNLKTPIQAAIMANGTIRILGGHHRVRSLQVLNEKYIPAELYVWDQMSSEFKDLYRESFIEPLKAEFPSFYLDLEKHPDLFN